MTHARLNPDVVRGTGGRFAIAIKIDQFDGDTPAARLDAALAWCAFVESEVFIDLCGQDVGEISRFGLSNVTFIGVPG